MAEAKRYNVGPDQGFAQATIMKLTDEQARQMGLDDSNVSDLKLTADDVTKRDAYDDAMTSQSRMRERESTLAAESSEEAPAKSKKRGAPAAADAAE